MFRNWLLYNNFPTFNVPGESAGGGAAPVELPPNTEPGMPVEPVETPVELNESEAFALEAFEQAQADEPEDEPLRPIREPYVEPGAPAVPETPAATQVVQAPKAPVAPTPEPLPAGAATPPVPPGGQQTAVQPGVVTPAAEPAQPVAPATTPDESTLHGLAEALNTQRDVFVKQLAKQRYTLSPEDQDRFNTEPGEFIAEMAARVQVETTQSLMRVMWSQLPGLINQTVQKKVAEDSAENAFWGANPALNRVQHKALVDSVAPVFRKNFPQADEATFNKHVGSMVLGMLGQTALAVQQQVNGGAPNGAHPPVATPGRVVRVVSAPSFAPAGGHAAPATSAPVQPKSEWEVLYDLTRRDDAGEFE